MIVNRVLVCAFLLLAVQTFVHAVQAIQVTPLVRDGRVYVSFRLSDAFDNEDIRAAVHSGLTITFVPSQHWSRRGLTDTNEALWGGFVVEGGGARVYHSGDTAYFEGFREIGQCFPRLDAALLPIGAYDPEWFMRPQHMSPEDAVQAFVDLGARRLLPMHWGTFKLTDEPLDEPPRRLNAEWQRRGLPPEALSILPIGASLALPAAAEAPSNAA